VYAELDTQNLLRTLPSAQRVAVASTQLLELTAKEIESRFGQSANAVRVNVHRGLARLREHVTASEHPMPQTEGVSYA
jgi:DNA-directed RNA polymerase specialized sigma24 family protein